MSRPTIRRILSPTEVQELCAAAKADDHLVVSPSHILRKNGEVCGYFSAQVPAVHIWASTKLMTAGDSMASIATMESLMDSAGHSSIIVPCNDQSPFFPLMERMGYTKLWPTVLFYKQLTNLQNGMQS